jgi:alpha-L-fucosidase
MIFAGATNERVQLNEQTLWLGSEMEMGSHQPFGDVLWWDYSAQDFEGDAAWRATDLMNLVRSKQPGIITNNRLFRSSEAGWKSMGTEGYAAQLDPKYGDFITPEQHIPATGTPGVDWETCMTLSTTWGYSEHDHAWKSDGTLIRNVVDIAGKGGNYLLNIGPKCESGGALRGPQRGARPGLNCPGLTRL